MVAKASVDLMDFFLKKLVFLRIYNGVWFWHIVFQLTKKYGIKERTDA